MRVDGGGLGLPEADEVDDVGEDFDKAVMRRAEEVGEGEVGDTALRLVGQHLWFGRGKYVEGGDIGLYSLRREASVKIRKSP